MAEPPSLIWINGAFGVGKTSVARRLEAKYSCVWLFDPEQIGCLLHRLMPWSRQRDFQTLSAWRKMTVQALQQALGDRPDQVPVVPMTLVEPAWFAEIMGNLRGSGITVHHFALLASERTLRRRVGWRIDRLASRRWALDRIEPCRALAGAQFATHVQTDGRLIPEIAAEIVEALPAPLRARLA
jgi:hypothetical protein